MPLRSARPSRPAGTTWLIMVRYPMKMSDAIMAMVVCVAFILIIIHVHMRRLKVKESDYKKYNYFVDLFVVWCCDQSFTHDQSLLSQKIGRISKI